MKMKRLNTLLLSALLAVAAYAQEEAPTSRLTGVTGFVLNQDLEPVPNAKLSLNSLTSLSGKEDRGYITTTTDEMGHYLLHVDTLRETNHITASANGYSQQYHYNMRLLDEGSAVADIIICNKAKYKAGQCATVVMPTTPDASLGRYFRLDRVEDGKVYFERELSPQADTPYIIIPDKDFEIDYDPSLPSLAGRVTVKGAYFIGFYQTQSNGFPESDYGVLFDTSNDCEYLWGFYASKEHTVLTGLYRVGAYHAIFGLNRNEYNWNQYAPSSLTDGEKAFNWREMWFFKEVLCLHDATTDTTFMLDGQRPESPAPAFTAFAGFVLNQDNDPVVHAQVSLRNGASSYMAETDEYGHFLMPVDDGNGKYTVSISAEGYGEQQQYLDGWGEVDFKDGANSKKYTLFNAALYRKDRQSTIILPTAPDAALGRYYRLSKVENGKVVFDRVAQPEANVPYVIFPNEDFRVDYGSMVFPEEAGETVVDGARLKGVFSRTPFRGEGNGFGMLLDNLWLMDKSPDCEFIYTGEHSIDESGCIVGALHAVLLLEAEAAVGLEHHWPLDYFAWQERSFVFNDNVTGMENPPMAGSRKDSTLRYNLYGQKVGTSYHGLILQGGRKYLVK